MTQMGMTRDSLHDWFLQNMSNNKNGKYKNNI